MKLFRKHLGLNLPTKDRLKKVLKDWGNWDYYEHTDEVGIQYTINPAFKVVFVDKNSNVKADAFSLPQVRVDISWETALLKCGTDKIEEYNVVNLDGGQFKAVFPDTGAIKC